MNELQYFTYDQYLDYMRRHWHNGQHIGIVGSTGSGKTNIIQDLIGIRKHAVVFATKSKDKTLEKFGLPKIKSWPGQFDQTHVMLWIKPKQLGDFREQQAGFYLAMNDIYQVGGWCVVYDDLFYVANTLGLKRAVQMFYTQVRSQNVSIISNMQRPRWVLVEAITEATYLILFRLHDTVDLERVAEGTGYNKKELIAANDILEPYEFLLLQVGHDPIRVQKRPE